VSGACGVDGEERGVYRGFVGKPEEKRTNTGETQEVGCRGMDWIGLTQHRDR
jgi:hypothetical protein